VRLVSPIGGATGGRGSLSTSLFNVVRQAAHLKFVWVFNANCFCLCLFWLSKKIKLLSKMNLNSNKQENLPHFIFIHNGLLATFLAFVYFGTSWQIIIQQTKFKYRTRTDYCNKLKWRCYNISKTTKSRGKLSLCEASYRLIHL
jgi:hypothetical protein